MIFVCWNKFVFWGQTPVGHDQLSFLYIAVFHLPANILFSILHLCWGVWAYRFILISILIFVSVAYACLKERSWEVFLPLFFCRSLYPISSISYLSFDRLYQRSHLGLELIYGQFTNCGFIFSSEYRVCSSAKVAIRKHHRVSVLGNSNLVSYSSGGWKSDQGISRFGLFWGLFPCLADGAFSLGPHVVASQSVSSVS